MQFDPENLVNKLCACGMQAEGEGQPEEAAIFFKRAWNEAGNAREKFTAAHYVARHQNSIAGKLEWDIVALGFALEAESPESQSVYPSLYLNVAKGFEDMGDFDKAIENYRLALSYTMFLPLDGYGNMIRAGISKGIQRLKNHDD